MLFGIIYSGTVAQFPKAIFVTGSVMCMLALVTVSFVKNPVAKVPLLSKFSKSKPPTQRRRDIAELERGRSRVSKDLRGGAIPYYSQRSYGTMANGFADASERV